MASCQEMQNETECAHQKDSVSDSSEIADNSKTCDRGQAYERLCHATDRTVNRVTSKSKTKIWAYFKEHFRLLYEGDRKYVMEVYKEMIGKLEEAIKDEIQLQLEASEVQNLLAELDKIIADSPASNRRWRPSGDPKEDMKAHLQQSSINELQQLEKIKSSLQYQNQLLNDYVARTDQKLEQTVQKLKSHVGTWEKAASIMPDDTREALITTHESL